MLLVFLCWQKLAKEVTLGGAHPRRNLGGHWGNQRTYLWSNTFLKNPSIYETLLRLLWFNVPVTKKYGRWDSYPINHVSVVSRHRRLTNKRVSGDYIEGAITRSVVWIADLPFG